MKRIFITIGLWLALAAPTYAASQTFNITAKQFSYSPSSITVTEGDSVTLNLTSSDVTHGFSLSAFGVSATINPDKTSTVHFTADTAGTYTFSCSVFCGSGHAGMKGTLVVKEASATNTNTTNSNTNSTNTNSSNSNNNTNSTNANANTNSNSNANSNANANSNTNSTNTNSSNASGTVSILTMTAGTKTYNVGSDSTTPVVAANTSIHLTGTASPSAAVVIEFCCSVTRYTVTADADGEWAFQGTPSLDEGSQTVKAYESGDSADADTIDFTVGDQTSVSNTNSGNTASSGGLFDNIVVWVIIGGIVLMVGAGAFFARSMRR